MLTINHQNPQSLSITAAHHRSRKLFLITFRIPKPQAGGSNPFTITTTKPPDGLFGGFCVWLVYSEI
jgi:hypothetical protein